MIKINSIYHENGNLEINIPQEKNELLILSFIFIMSMIRCVLSLITKEPKCHGYLGTDTRLLLEDIA